MSDIPATGLVRLKQIIGPGKPIPVSKTKWWDGIRSGDYPSPIYLGSRLPAWRAEDIHALICDGIKRKPATGRAA
jgi:prophage regulatory protein